MIRGPLDDSEIVITTTSRLAGAIHSLKWNGKEFVDSFDHGRQVQSAANFDCGTRFSGETFNPTEAGSRRDGSGPTSSSRLLHMVVAERTLQTTTRMAFWLAPDENSAGHPAKNKTLLSNHLVTKRVTIGYKDLPNVIVYDATFRVPVGERHRFAQFEAVTGYMPAEFSRFWKYNTATKRLEPLTDGPGEQAWPVVLATEGGDYAMGVFSPQQPAKGYEHAGYGRFRFRAEKVTKWNCVFRVRDEQIKAADYSFRSFVIVGDLAKVRQSMEQLHVEFSH